MQVMMVYKLIVCFTVWRAGLHYLSDGFHSFLEGEMCHFYTE